MGRIFLGLTAFVVLWLLFLAGQHTATPPAAPPPAPAATCPPPTTITLPPETATATATATVHAAWLQRGPACPGVVVLGT